MESQNQNEEAGEPWSRREGVCRVSRPRPTSASILFIGAFPILTRLGSSMPVAGGIPGYTSIRLVQGGRLFWQSFIRGGSRWHGGDMIHNSTRVGLIPKAAQVPFA